MLINIGDNELLVHRVILACRSPFYRKNDNDDELNLKDIDGLKQIIKYIYTGRIAIDTLSDDTGCIQKSFCVLSYLFLLLS